MTTEPKTNPYDPDKSARLAAEAAEAMVGVTPGEWRFDEDGEIRSYRRDDEFGDSLEDNVAVVYSDDGTGQFIAYARQGVPALAAALQDANAEVERKDLEIAAKDHRFSALEASLRQAERWFREYEASHRAKVKPSDDPFTQAAANDKADRNRDRAEFCAHALLETGHE